MSGDTPRLDIASLEQSLRALDAAEHNLRDTQSAHARAEEEYRRLDQQYTEGQRDFLLREAEAKGWDPWWLRFRYGDLFGPPAAPPRQPRPRAVRRIMARPAGAESGENHPAGVPGV